MKIRSIKNIWMAVICLMISFIAFPDQILSKTTKTSKATKSLNKAKTTEKAQAPQTTRPPPLSRAASVVMLNQPF
jgi:hypothetical protein